MIRTIVGLAVAGIALAPFADKSAPPAVDAPWVAEFGVDPIVTREVAPSDAVRHLRVSSRDGQCMVSVTDAAAVRAEPACASVQAGLENASVWTVKGDEAAIADATSYIILEIGASDGFAFEGTSATGNAITLTETDI